MLTVAALVPVIACDTADAEVTHTVTLKDYDALTVIDTTTIHGDRCLADENPGFLDCRPYWWNLRGGYEWTIYDVVTEDMVLVASETQPPQAPQDTPLDLTPYLGAVFIGLVAIGLLVGYRRLWNAS